MITYEPWSFLKAANLSQQVLYSTGSARTWKPWPTKLNGNRIIFWMKPTMFWLTSLSLWGLSTFQQQSKIFLKDFSYISLVSNFYTGKMINQCCNTILQLVIHSLLFIVWATMDSAFQLLLSICLPFPHVLHSFLMFILSLIHPNSTSLLRFFLKSFHIN